MAATLVLWAAASAAMPSAPGTMAATWASSSTWHHGFLVLPAAAWLIWRDRAAFEPARPSLLAAGAVALFGAMWAAAHAVGVNLGEQLAYVGVLAASFAAVYGLANASRAALGLGFLLFAPPSGESLAPLLQQGASVAVTALLGSVGVDVLRTGTVIETTAGRFVIAEACAGLNFLLAAGAVAVFYAAVAFAGWRKRAAFIAFAIAAALLANVLRAFLVILIATRTPLGMAFAHDHAAFGWAIYAVFLFALMAVGRALRDETGKRTSVADAGSVRLAGAPLLAALAAIVAAGALGPVAADAAPTVVRVLTAA